MKKRLLLLLIFTFSNAFSQKLFTKKADFFRISPPLIRMANAGPRQPSANPFIGIEKNTENEWHPQLVNNGLHRSDPLSAVQQNYKSVQAESIQKIIDFDGLTNLDGVAPPDTQGDVNANYYMQCVNNHTIIKDRNGNTVVAAFPTSNFWQGTQFDDRNDGDAVILWDENAQRWLVTQFYIPSSGDQYLLIAVSKTADPTGQYYQYGFNYQSNMPDYPKWAIWPDAYYMGANAFESGSFKGSVVTAFERDKILQGDPNARLVSFGPDSNLWSVFPADADAFPAVGTPCPFIADEVNSTSGNNEVYIYNFHVDWNNVNNSTFSRVSDLTVASYGLFSSNTEVPQPGTSQKLDLLQYRVMYRPYFRHFSDHESLVMTRTVDDGGVTAIRWYEFRNTGNGWSVYQQGTYNPGDGLWRWMPSIAMNADGDISIAYSVSNSSNKYPSIRTVARRANDPLGQMTTNESELFTGSHSQTGVSRWGDYAMVSVDPDGSSFWFTTEYTTGNWDWRTRIIHYQLPPQCVTPSTQASNFNANNIGDNQMEISWTRGNGDRVLVVARQDAAVNEDPTNGTGYNANAQFGTGDQIGNGNYVVYDGTGTNVTVTGLNTATTYHFAIYEYTASTHCYNKNELTGNATTTGNAPCNMCYAYGNTSYQTSTTAVVFNTINNTSAKPTDAQGHAYSDYTNLSTDVALGSSYNLTVKVNTDGNYNVKTKVWFDWNHDCDFDDPGEEYDMGQATNTANGTTSASPLSISIPNNAVIGTTRMRVITKYNAYATACETNFDGEVEDYSVKIIEASVDTQAPSAPTNLVADNITQTTLDLSWTASTDNVGVTGYNVYQDGNLLGTVTGTTAQVTNLTANTAYSFYVKAKDNAGNISAASNTVNVTTLPENTGGNCTTTINSFPYYEGFENTIGAWEQSADDDFDWTTRSGSTPSSGTGPSGAAEGSYYVYMESSSPNYSNKRAILISPCFDLAGMTSASVSFKYHMYGDASKMGSLALEISSDNGATWNSVWSKSGNQGNAWYTANVNLDSYTGQTVKLRFNGITGTTWQGDMAVDGFNFDASVQAACVATTLSITFDNYPEETSWEITDGSGNVVYSGGTYGSEPDGSTKVINMCIDTGCYTFTMKDAYGDGMCCSYGNGSYSFTKDSDGTVLASGGSFQSSESTNFCLNTNGFAASENGQHSNMTDISIYPNPVGNIMMVYLKDQNMSRYTITNMTGQIVAKGLLNSDSINVSQLEAGVYFVKFTSDKKMITQRFVKK